MMDQHGWNDRYAAADLVWSAEPNQFFADAVRDLTPGRALDLGTGEGRNAMWLAERGWDVTAVDFSDVAIDKARQIAARRDVRVTWVVADLRDYNPQQRPWPPSHRKARCWWWATTPQTSPMGTAVLRTLPFSSHQTRSSGVWMACRWFAPERSSGKSRRRTAREMPSTHWWLRSLQGTKNAPTRHLSHHRAPLGDHAASISSASMRIGLTVIGRARCPKRWTCSGAPVRGRRLGWNSGRDTSRSARS